MIQWFINMSRGAGVTCTLLIQETSFTDFLNKQLSWLAVVFIEGVYNPESVYEMKRCLLALELDTVLSLSTRVETYYAKFANLQSLSALLRVRFH